MISWSVLFCLMVLHYWGLLILLVKIMDQPDHVTKFLKKFMYPQSIFGKFFSVYLKEYFFKFGEISLNIEDNFQATMWNISHKLCNSPHHISFPHIFWGIFPKIMNCQNHYKTFPHMFWGIFQNFYQKVNRRAYRLLLRFPNFQKDLLWIKKVIHLTKKVTLGPLEATETTL